MRRSRAAAGISSSQTTRTQSARSTPSGTAWHASSVTEHVCGASSESRRASRACRSSASTESPYPVLSSSAVVPCSAISCTSDRQKASTSSSLAAASMRALR